MVVRRRMNDKRILINGVVLLYIFQVVLGFSSMSIPKIPAGRKRLVVAMTERGRSGRRGAMSMYLPANTPVSQTAPMIAKSILAAPGCNSKGKKRQHSGSVLASTDTLPLFQTAHGLLSPETVMRMDETMRRKHQVRDRAVTLFLDTYRNEGPMACLPMLSDPAILPRLTEAMRDIDRIDC